MPSSMPKNCEANDELGQVGFDLELDGATWRACVSYDALARMFTPPRHGASLAAVRDCRVQLVGQSKAIARLVIERVRAGARTAERIVIS